MTFYKKKKSGFFHSNLVKSDRFWESFTYEQLAAINMYFKNCYFSQLSIFKAIKAVCSVTQETNSYLFFASQQQDRWRSSSDDVVPVLLLLSPLAACCCCCCCVPLFDRYSLLCIIFLDGVRPGPDSRSGQLLIHPPTRPPPLLLPTCNRCSPPPPLPYHNPAIMFSCV